MRRLLSYSVLAALLLAVPLSSCSDQQSPIEPTPAAPIVLSPEDSADLLLGELIGGLTGTVTGVVGGVVDLAGALLNGVLACPTSQTYSTAKYVGPWGGTVYVGPHRLYIPPGALDRYVRIEAIAPAGDVTTLRFEPHGLEFDRPTLLTMSYEHCGLLSSAPRKIVYVDGQLTVLEVLPSMDSYWRREVNGKLDHFSRYAVAE